jgi:uncharacterized membrane protein YozB (DUF420 family)
MGKGLYVGISIWMGVMVLAGFWPGYFGPLLGGNVDVTTVIHWHAVVFVIWVLLFFAQALLVARGNVKKHMSLGKIGMYYGILVLIMGLTVGFVRSGEYMAEGNEMMSQAMIFVGVRDMLVFGVLFGLAMYYRKKPEKHRVYILAASSWILIAAVARLNQNMGGNAISFLLLLLLPVFAAMAGQWRNQQKVSKEYYYIIAAFIFFGELPDMIMMFME